MMRCIARRARLSGVVCALLSASMAAGATPGAGALDVRSLSGRPAEDVVRACRIGLDAAAFTSVKVGESRRVDLLDGVSLEVTVSAVIRRPSGCTWHGKIVGEPLGTCTVTVENGILCAGFWSERGSFGIVPARTGERDAAGRPVYAVEQLAPEAVCRCLMSQGVPGLAPGYSVPEHWNQARERWLDEGVGASSHAAAPGARPAGPADSTSGVAPSTRACGCPDDQSIVDVMCVYTTLAKNAAGGAAALQARVQNAIDAANGAYTNSGINSSGVNRLQLRITGYAETSYNEQSPQFLDHLVRVTDPDDGFMDEVHALRDQQKADAVMLVVDDTRFIGGAGWWAIWDQGQAFSCENWRTMGGGDLLLAHEIGHNFGCAHDHENDASAPFSYAWGHYFTVGGNTYRTIMAYPGNVSLQYFSNPHLTHSLTGQPLGVAVGQPRAAYNAYVIQQTRWTLANYRDATRIVDCNGNGVDDASDIASGTSLDANGNCRPDECEERRYADAQTPGPGEGRTWSNAGGDLAEILAVADLSCGSISQVWVADGSYTPDSGSGYTYASFGMRSGLALYGGFQGKSGPGGGETSLGQRDPATYVSTLSGEIGDPQSVLDNSYSVVTAYGTDSHSILDGFAISSGYSDGWGAGLYLEGSSLHVTGCTFESNQSWGGAGAAAWTGGSPVFTRCVFQYNATSGGGGGGVSANDGVAITLDRCEFHDNQGAWGGAAAIASASADVRGCTMVSNEAYLYNGGALDVDHSQLALANSLIADNHAQGDAGGVWTASDTLATVTNCTIAHNSSTYTGGLVAYFDTANVTNSILWGNTGGLASQQDRQLLYYVGTGTVGYSRVKGWTGSLGGTHNSGADPLFGDPGNGDYSLATGSASIDAGNSAALPADIANDVLGNARIVDDPATLDTGSGAPTVDIGAIEFQPCAADFDASGFVDLDDYVAFVLAFESGGDEADFDHTGFVDLDDFVAFVLAFEAGC